MSRRDTSDDAQAHAVNNDCITECHRITANASLSALLYLLLYKTDEDQYKLSIPYFQLIKDKFNYHGTELNNLENGFTGIIS